MLCVVRHPAPSVNLSNEPEPGWFLVDRAFINCPVLHMHSLLSLALVHKHLISGPACIVWEHSHSLAHHLHFPFCIGAFWSLLHTAQTRLHSSPGRSMFSLSLLACTDLIAYLVYRLIVLSCCSTLSVSKSTAYDEQSMLDCLCAHSPSCCAQWQWFADNIVDSEKWQKQCLVLWWFPCCNRKALHKIECICDKAYLPSNLLQNQIQSVIAAVNIQRSGTLCLRWSHSRALDKSCVRSNISCHETPGSYAPQEKLNGMVI